MTFWGGLIIDLRKTYNAAEGDKCPHEEECPHAITFKDCTAGQIELEMPTDSHSALSSVLKNYFGSTGSYPWQPVAPTLGRQLLLASQGTAH